MHQANIGATDFSKCIQVILSHFIRNHGSRSNDFNAGCDAAGFFHYPSKNSEFKKIEVIAVEAICFPFCAFVFGATYGNQFSFRITHSSGFG